MKSQSARNRFPAGLALSLALGLGLGLGPAASSLPQARAARSARVTAPAAAVAPPRAGQSRNKPPLPLGARLARLAEQAASRAGTTSGAGSTASPSVPTTVSGADPLNPSTLLDPITKSNFVKDFGSLFAFQSGKLVNWNQQTLNKLATDLGFKSTSRVAPKLTTSRPVLEAQVVNGSPSATAATVQPAPVPEPSTLLVFALGLGALAARRKWTERHARSVSP